MTGVPDDQSRSAVHQGWGGSPGHQPAGTHLLATNPLFGGVPETYLETLSRHLVERHLSAQTVIFEEDDPGHAVHIIHTGFIRIQTVNADGVEVVLALLGPGDVLGEISMIDRLGRSATAIAHEPVVFYTLNRAQFASLLDEIPALSRNLNAILARRLRLANAHIRSLAALGVEGRIAHELLTWVHEFGDPAGNLPFRLTQTELASFVGASRVRVNQVMGEFRRLSLVRWDEQHHITITDPESLARLYHTH